MSNSVARGNAAAKNAPDSSAVKSVLPKLCSKERRVLS